MRCVSLTAIDYLYLFYLLWDYGKEVTESLSGLTKILKRRFGGKNFTDKHRIEIRNRRRTPTETLQSLHIDTRKLAALAFPSMDHRTREIISCNYFLDALADPDFALKIRERHPEDLDSALRIALQLEVWTRDSIRLREATKGERSKDFGSKDEARGEPKKIKEITKFVQDPNNEVFKKEVEEPRKKIAELESKLSKPPETPPPCGAFDTEASRCSFSKQAKSYAYLLQMWWTWTHCEGL